MSDAVRERLVREPKLLLAFLKSFYDVVVPLAWPMARLASRVSPHRPRLGQGHAWRDSL
jgi:hypothetical protein